ncbi:MAG TPA: chemotaxis protein CheW [Terracidiphilus sp.]|nr:chemotaxis protein CheW [Terracidiphilus sp.]
MDELTREFLIESQEGLDRMERCLTQLESTPDDAGLLAEIFRAVHTIKGTTGFLGFKRLEKLAHAGENLLGQLRDGKLAATPEIITCQLQLLDVLRSILKLIEEQGEEGGGDCASTDETLITRLEELQNPEAVKATAHATARAGGAAKPKSSGSRRRKTASAASVAAPMDPIVELPVAAGPGPVAAEEKDISGTGAESHGTASKSAPPPDSMPSSSSAAESTLRVDVALLNRMMNLVGELVLTRNQVLQATASDARMTMLSRRLDMVTADLRESVMKARMQPVSNIFSKVPRMVRDISRDLGKRVRLEMEGQDTELDKSLLEAIKDPLTHAVRNSLDHGIEPPNVREKSGKDPEGTLKLRAAQEGSHVIVEISDDGSGISVERVRAKAIERDLITEERAAQMSERELLQLIFVPGFSTAQQITHVSGRGVGMDVVRTNVEKIGGKIEIDSRVGKGTTLRMRIPLTLAIVPALIVRSLGQSFALPQGALSELVHVPPGQADSAIEWIEDVPLYRLRGQLLPLVLLDRLLMPDRDHDAGSGSGGFIAILESDGRRYGLIVDELADPEEIVVKPLSPVLKDIGVFSGATVLGNADLALILDPGAIAGKAGVKLLNESDVAENRQAVEDAGSRREYLLVEVGGRRAAVPLGDVLRIEQLPVKRVEYIGHQPVLNFESQLMPLEDAGGLISSDVNPESQIIVVVCRESDRLVGIAVSHVLDVASGAEVFEAGTTRLAKGVTLLKERMTSVVYVAGVAAIPADVGELEEQQPAGEISA